jgi:hypothetical protein
MALRDEMAAYIDGNGLCAPNPAGPGQGSDNGPMFTSEYYIMLAKSGQLTEQDRADYVKKISSCIYDNLLNRAPYPTGQEGPDDYYGVLSACAVMGITDIPRSLLKGMFEHFGFMDNDPSNGKWSLNSILPRQSQLVAALVAASFPSKLNPLHYLVRLAAFPWFLYAAVCIAISCQGTDKGDTDARRLSWHLIQAMKPVSLMCWIASIFWFKRLWNDYPNGMKDVAVIYYQPHDMTNPYAKYWVT